MAGFLGKLIVNLTVLLICFIAYSSQIFIIWPWYGGVVSVQLITLLVPFKYAEIASQLDLETDNNQFPCRDALLELLSLRLH